MKKVKNENIDLSFLLASSHCLKITQNVAFWHFPTIYCLVALSDRQQNGYFGIFNQLLSTQNENLARFARNVERDFFCHFQTACILQNAQSISLIVNQHFIM